MTWVPPGRPIPDPHPGGRPPFRPSPLLPAAGGQGGPSPGSTEWLRARLFEQRTLLLTGTLDDDAAGEVAAQLMTLDATGDGAIRLRIDSGDGTLDAAATLVDVIDLLGVPVDALAVGRAEGPAFVVLACCRHRAAGPTTRLRLYEPDEQLQGDATDAEGWIERRRHRNERLGARLAEATGRTREAVAADLAGGRFLTPEEARRLGYIDEVAGGRATITHLPRPFGFTAL